MPHAKHTPGPWTAEPYGNRRTLVHAGDGGNPEAFAAEVFGPNQATDARLIAAAPTMLEALRKAELDLIEAELKEAINTDTLSIVRRAIAAAVSGGDR
jgi:hypothetical protein